MKKIINIRTILLLVLIAGVVYVIFFHEPETITHTETIYKTDTVYVDKPYEVPVPYEVSVPPRYITRYVVDSSAIDSLKLLLDSTSIIISGLQSEIAIHQSYLKQFPRNPKLVSLALAFDTLSLTLLNIDGIVSNSSYPIFTDFYRYTWLNGQLTKEDNKRPPVPTQHHLNYLVGLGYDILFLSPYIEGEVNYDWRRFNAYGRINVGTKFNSAQLGIKYNLGKHAKVQN